MSTIAIPKSALPSFVNKPEEYGLYNPALEHLDLMWGGRSLRLPGCKDIGHRPCHFDDGTPVPGTLVIQDAYCAGSDGLMPKAGSAFNWRAADAIRNMLGIDVLTGAAHSAKAKRGITFIPPVVDKDTFEAVKADAEMRYAAHTVAWAEAEVRAFEASLDKSKRAGVAAPPPDSGYHRAVAILAEHRTRTAGVVQHENEVIKDSEAAEIAAMKAIAMEMATEAAGEREVDKGKLAEKLLSDPKVRQYLSKEAKIRVRKVGHMPDPGDAKE